jgi:Protein of unknown function (DUF2946)
MQWLRSNKLAAWCAIFALALQLVSSFGHVHRGGTMRPFAVSFLAATSAHLSKAPATTQDLPRPGDLGLEFCGICTIIALAGTLVPPASPALPLPAVVSGVEHWASIDFATTPLRHFIFQARAPPQA